MSTRDPFSMSRERRRFVAIIRIDRRRTLTSAVVSASADDEIETIVR